jgi:hypothetical protein
MNPYQVEAGPELDEFLHRELFHADPALTAAPPYSINHAESAQIKNRLRAIKGYPIVVGRVGTRRVQYFARLDSDPSTATEAIAETEPLAICRLAAVLLMKK